MSTKPTGGEWFWATVVGAVMLWLVLVGVGFALGLGWRWAQ